ncbi:hypothetical protein [Schumannella sp. 10F1B-5-1]|uniref:hypothetical protein n=1 Tax=Schumannella sp. 10F1B-5-1 TaxID=2590780 RepID=UPI0011322437|nr:hypothetical protein [Schumannella sp. 10F1B-5-1]TPW73107.1 hypothetical protein FJ658_07650 [Schumannella sp. 10F1B-5-1]
MSVPFPIVRRRVRRSPLLLGLVAVIAFAAALVNAGSAAGFPYRSPLEGLFNALITIDLVVMAVILGGSAVILLMKANRGEDAVVERIVIDSTGAPVVDEREPVPVMSIVGALLIGVTAVGWVILGGVPVVAAMILGHAIKYTAAVGPLALFGLLWVLGICFGALGFHRAESARNRLFSALAIAGGVILMAPAVGFSILYAAGVTN